MRCGLKCLLIHLKKCFFFLYLHRNIITSIFWKQKRVMSVRRCGFYPHFFFSFHSLIWGKSFPFLHLTFLICKLGVIISNSFAEYSHLYGWKHYDKKNTGLLLLLLLQRNQQILDVFKLFAENSVPWQKGQTNAFTIED